MLADWLRAGLASGRVTTPYPRKADVVRREHPHWNLYPQVVDRCSAADCRCSSICPVDAIGTTVCAGGLREVEIDLAACIGCGRCVEECVSDAVAWDDAFDIAWSESGESLADMAASLSAPALATSPSAPAPALATTQTASGQTAGDWPQLAEQGLAAGLRRIFGRSLYIRHIDVGSCNACESEVLSLSNPYYNLHRLGIFFTPSPRHADVLLITGALTPAMRPVLLQTYAAMPRPRLVVVAGVCTLQGGVFAKSPQFVGPIASVIPVDVAIPGCPPTPYALLHGLWEAMHRA